jgi:hypothetical protein
MKYWNERGMVPILVVVLVVVVVAAAAVALSNVSKSKSSESITRHTSTPSSTSSSSPSPVKASPAPTTTGSVGADGYLTIKEYGVRFKVGTGLTGLTYEYGTHGGTTNVQFGSTSLAQSANTKDKNNFCGGNGPLGILLKSSVAFQKPASGDNYDLTTKVGSYYYAYAHVQNACSQDLSVQAEIQRQHDALVQALKGLELVN